MVAASAHAATVYVSTTGTDGGAGTLADPLSFGKAISVSSPLSPGDSVLMRGGIYYGSTNTAGWASNVAGSVGNPITFQPYGTEIPVLECTNAASVCLYVNGAYTTWKGLEFVNTYPDRTVTRGSGLMVFGAHTTLIDLVIHDCANGIGLWTSASPSEVSGCVIYNNGMSDPADRNHYHGIYTHSQDPGHYIHDNVILNGWGFGLTCYAEISDPHLASFRIVGNASYNAGMLAGFGVATEPNFQMGGSSVAVTNAVFESNYGYHEPLLLADNLALGYLTYPMGDITVKSNVIAGGKTTISYWTNLVVGQNIFARYGTWFNYNPIATPGTIVWDTNTYYLSLAQPFKLAGASTSYAQWKTDTGFDGASTMNAANPTGLWTYIRTNAFTQGKANVIVYNWNLADNVTVDLSSVLTNGQYFCVKNAQDYRGAKIIGDSIYGGGSVTLPMTNLTVVAPIGSTAPASTGPEFAVFLVEPSQRRTTISGAHLSGARL